MKDSDDAPRFYAPAQFYRPSRGAQNRGNTTTAIEERTMGWRSGFAHDVMLIVHYDDGRRCYLTASNVALRYGDAAALALAARKQLAGEIPAGTIIGVRRVH